MRMMFSGRRCNYVSKKKTMQRNLDIREAAQNNAVLLWEIADKLGVTDSHFSRKLRHELPKAEKDRIFSIIEEIAKEENR